MEERFTPKELEYRALVMKKMMGMVTNKTHALGHLIENLSKDQPNKPALYFEDSSWTWGEFNSECNSYANFFQNLGLGYQESLAVILENCPEYLFITMGVTKIQGVSALININQRKNALIHALNLADPKYILVDGKNLPYFIEISKEIAVEKNRIFVINNFKGVPHEFREIDDDIKQASRNNPLTTKNSNFNDVIFYIYTSGTTGLPKAAKMKNVALSAPVTIVSLSQINSEDVSYLITPLYHSLGMVIVWGGTVFSKGAVVLRRRFSSSQFWSDVQKYKVSFSAMLGEIPRYLLNQPVSKDEKNNSLKKIVTLGLKKVTWNKFKPRFQIDHIYEIYSATEGYGPFINADEVPGMVGRLDSDIHLLLRVDPDTQEFLLDKDGKYQICKAGDVGMLLNVIQDIKSFELYKSKSATKKKVLRDVLTKDDAYLMTGDLFMLHDNRWISFADRLGDTFRWKGENVSSQEVENIIATHQSVGLCAVYGANIPNNTGKAGMAAIIVDPAKKFDTSEFLDFMNTSLPKYSIPLFIRLCKDLELTGSYKLKKVKLRSEGYDVTKIKDEIYFLDPSLKRYIPFDENKHNELLTGKLEI